MDELATRPEQSALETAAWWFGFGVAALPVFDIADQAGLFMLLGSSTLELELVAWPLTKIVFFVAVGIAAASVMRRHRPSARPWFFAGCALPVLAYVLLTGLRLAVVAALVALCFSFVQLRLARNAAPYRARGLTRPGP